MEWLQKFNQALDYVEDNLEGEIEYETAARIACCSTFHFQRMFSYIAGIPLGEYIRHLRCKAGRRGSWTLWLRLTDRFQPGLPERPRGSALQSQGEGRGTQGLSPH